MTRASELGSVAQRMSRCKGSLSPGSVTWLSQALLGGQEIVQNQPLSSVDPRRDSMVEIREIIKPLEPTHDRRIQESRLCTSNGGDDGV